jgi:hypothetical protein
MCWHKWTKWREITEEKERLGMFGKYTQTVWYMRRDCEKCGLFQIHKVTAI